MWSSLTKVIWKLTVVLANLVNELSIFFGIPKLCDLFDTVLAREKINIILNESSNLRLVGEPIRYKFIRKPIESYNEKELIWFFVQRRQETVDSYYEISIFKRNKWKKKHCTSFPQFGHFLSSVTQQKYFLFLCVFRNMLNSKYKMEQWPSNGTKFDQLKLWFILASFAHIFQHKIVYRFLDRLKWRFIFVNSQCRWIVMLMSMLMLWYISLSHYMFVCSKAHTL